MRFRKADCGKHIYLALQFGDKITQPDDQLVCVCVGVLSGKVENPAFIVSVAFIAHGEIGIDATVNVHVNRAYFKLTSATVCVRVKWHNIVIEYLQYVDFY